MKKLLASLLLCFATAASFAQAKSLRVTNTTGCNVLYRVWGQTSPCPFLGTFGSTIVSFPPGSTTYPNSGALGLPSNLWIVAAYAFNAPASCGIPPVTTYPVGDPCTGFPLTQPMYSTTSCVLCTQHFVRWIPAPTPGGMAQLVFHP